MCCGAESHCFSVFFSSSLNCKIDYYGDVLQTTAVKDWACNSEEICQMLIVLESCSAVEQCKYKRSQSCLQICKQTF